VLKSPLGYTRVSGPIHLVVEIVLVGNTTVLLSGFTCPYYSTILLRPGPICHWICTWFWHYVRSIFYSTGLNLTLVAIGNEHISQFKWTTFAPFPSLKARKYSKVMVYPSC